MMLPERIDDYSVNELAPHRWECYDHLADINEAKAHFRRKYGKEPERMIEQYKRDGTLRYRYLGPVESVT